MEAAGFFPSVYSAPNRPKSLSETEPRIHMVFADTVFEFVSSTLKTIIWEINHGERGGRGRGVETTLKWNKNISLP